MEPIASEKLKVCSFFLLDIFEPSRLPALAGGEEIGTGSTEGEEVVGGEAGLDILVVTHAETAVEFVQSRRSERSGGPG